MLRIVKTIINKHRYGIMLKLYSKSKRTRKLFYKLIDKYEGGMINSKTLRRIFSEQYNVFIGYASYGCFDPLINYGSPIEIGNYCSIADDVHFIPGNHPPTDVSTHPFFHRTEFGFVHNSGGELKRNKSLLLSDMMSGLAEVLLFFLSVKESVMVRLSGQVR